MPTNTALLDAALRRHFAPALKADGWRASGRTYRKVVDDMLFVVGVQGSQFGGRFCVNLGAQPLAIPDATGRPVDASKTKDSACEFRSRISADDIDTWWDHGGDADAMVRAAGDAADAFALHAGRFFDRFTGPAAWLRTLTPEELVRTGPALRRPLCTSEIRLGFVFAQLRLAEGRAEEARRFADWTLDNSLPAFAGRERLREIAGLPAAV